MSKSHSLGIPEQRFPDDLKLRQLQTQDPYPDIGLRHWPDHALGDGFALGTHPPFATANGNAS